MLVGNHGQVAHFRLWHVRDIPTSTVNRDQRVTNSGLICSFCGKEPEEVVSLVNAVSLNPKGRQTAGAICNECVELCAEVIGLQKPEWLERHRQFVATLGK